MKNIKKLIFVLAIPMLLLLVGFSPATAIKYGELDGEDHPHVVLIVAYDETGWPLWRGSGTLISPSVVLTAGHVTETPAVTAAIWLESDVDAGRPENGYPWGGGTSISGVCFPHPEYYSAPWFINDIGVVILDEPVYMEEYGVLPNEGILDELATKRGRQDTTLTAVGYGWQHGLNQPLKGPKFLQADKVRYQATLNLVDVEGTAGIPAGHVVMVSGNANTGGTCFGDSGGPLFLGDSNTVVAVTSFGLNGNCAGVGGGNRVDTENDLAWLYSWLA